MDQRPALVAAFVLRPELALESMAVPWRYLAVRELALVVRFRWSVVLAAVAQALSLLSLLRAPLAQAALCPCSLVHRLQDQAVL